MRTLLFLLALTVSLNSFSQKQLKTSQITSLQTWQPYGLDRNYTREELLFFIEASGWQAKYGDNRFVPYIIQKGSDQLINQYFIETRALCYKMTLEPSAFDDAYEMLTEIYGSIPKSEFKKYCYILVFLSKVDMSTKK
jgi:hypothetical protein